MHCNPDYHGGMLCRRGYPGISACTRSGGKALCLDPSEFERLRWLKQQMWLNTFSAAGRSTPEALNFINRLFAHCRVRVKFYHG